MTTKTLTATETYNDRNAKVINLLKLLTLEVQNESDKFARSGKAPNWANAGDAGARLGALTDAASMFLNMEPEDVRAMLDDMAANS